MTADPDPFLKLPAPDPHLRACVVVPAKDEERSLPRLVASLAAQVDLKGRLLYPAMVEAIILLNNTSDASAAVLREWKARYPRLRLHVATVRLEAEEAHVGRARQLLFDVAAARFMALERPEGLILSTDADTRPAADWVAANRAEIAAGVDGVGGRVQLEPAERAALDPGVRRLFLLDIGYRRALEELRWLYTPEPHDPAPRHHQHFGASLAVTAGAYMRSGGMPPAPTSEDVALVRAVEATGGRFRHSYRARVFTSARAVGRAEGGLADAFQWWIERVRAGHPVLVESAGHAERRLAWLGLWSADHPGAVPPEALAATPEPPPGGGGEIGAVLNDLRVCIERLRALSHPARLEAARARWGDAPALTPTPLAPLPLAA